MCISGTSISWLHPLDGYCADSVIQNNTKYKHVHFLLSDLQVHDRRVSLFLDGLEEDGTPYGSRPLPSRLFDTSEDGAMWVGLSSNGKDRLFKAFLTY